MRSLFAAILLSCSLLPAAPAVMAAEEKPLRIGVVLPLSGSSASLGTYVKNGIELAYDGLSAERKKRIKVLFEDDAWKTSQSVSAFQKLTTVKKASAVLVVGSAVGNALAPIAERRKIPLVAIGASDRKIVDGRKFAFIHWVTPEVEAQVMAKEIARRNYQRLAVIGTEHEGVLAVLSALDEALVEQKLDSKVVLRETFLGSETSFQTYLAKVRKAEVDGIVVCLIPGSLASFAKQVKQFDISADLMGIELFEDEHEVAAAAGGLDGHWYVNADVSSAEFETAYREKYGSVPGWASANAYDSMQLIFSALEKVGDSSEGIAAYLANVENYVGAAGTYSSSGDNRFTLPATIKVVTKDGFKKLVDS